MATGNAVKGASARPLLYPVQLVVLVSQATADRIAADAAEWGVSKSAAARTHLEAGIESTTPEGETP